MIAAGLLPWCVIAAPLSRCMIAALLPWCPYQQFSSAQPTPSRVRAMGVPAHLVLLLLFHPVTLAYNINVHKLTLNPEKNATLFGWSLQHFKVGL